jgi:hypothetical protein
MNVSSSKGFSLAETVIALGVLTSGILGAAGVLVTGMQVLSSSPGDVVVMQKAAQAIESVFSARDSHKLTWDQIRNVTGAGTDGGVFIDGLTDLNLPGPDGLVNTADDTVAVATTVCPVVCWGVETTRLPGMDQTLGTADDMVRPMSQYQREIKIRDVPGMNGELRSIVVTVTYQNGATKRTYTLSSFISAYS